MTPADLNRRRRLLRVRIIAERMAQTERATRITASDSAAQLAARLRDEALRCTSGVGATTGGGLAATFALAARIRSAEQQMVVRRHTVDGDLALATSVMHAARRDTRSAELLVERGGIAAEAAADHAHAVPHRRRDRAR